MYAQAITMPDVISMGRASYNNSTDALVGDGFYVVFLILLFACTCENTKVHNEVDDCM
jgi:hypothetical protein